MPIELRTLFDFHGKNATSGLKEAHKNLRTSLFVGNAQ